MTAVVCQRFPYLPPISPLGLMPHPRISINQKFTNPILKAFNIEARSVFLSWRGGKYPPDTRFSLVKAELEPLRFEDVYEGCSPEKTIENLKPNNKYRFILKICHGDDALTIDELDLVTPDETVIQKSVFQLIRSVTEGDSARVAAIFREFRGQINVETNDRSGRTLLMIACQKGDLDTVKLLLDRGANPMTMTGSGKVSVSFSLTISFRRRYLLREIQTCTFFKILL
jgi:hypothetical protein